MTKKSKIKLLTSFIPLMLISTTILVSCSLFGSSNSSTPPSQSPGGNQTNPPAPIRPPSGGNLPDQEDQTIITTLPREEINEKTKVLPFAKLIKYTLEIPKITINNKPLTIEEQRERYLEVAEYLTGRSDSYPDGITFPKENSYYKHAADLFLKEDPVFVRLIPQYARLQERYFWNETEEWRNMFYAEMNEQDAFTASMIAIPYYIQTENMKQVSLFLWHYSWLQIKLIDAGKEFGGSAKEFFLKEGSLNNSLSKMSRQSLIKLQEYLDPLTGQQMGGKRIENGLFFSDFGIKDNHKAYKMLVEINNKEIAPLVYVLNSAFIDGDLGLNEQRRTFRDAENVFAGVANGQKVKYRKDFSKDELNQFWTNFYNKYSKQYNWQFSSE